MTTPTRARPDRRLGYHLAFATPMPAWQLAFFIAPLGLLAAISFWTVRNYRLQPDHSLAAWADMLSTDYFWSSALRSIGFASASALVLTVIAFPAAYAIAFVLRPRTRRLVMALLIVPFFTSYLVRVYSWQVLLAENGVVNALLAGVGLSAGQLLSTPFAVLVGYATLSLSIVTLLQVIALGAIDRRLVGAAQNLRCGPLRTVFAVILPAARPGLVIGALFAFIFAFGDFISPLYLGGGRYTTLPTLISDTIKAGQQWPQAAVVAVLMIATLLATAVAALAYAYRRP